MMFHCSDIILNFICLGADGVGFFEILDEMTLVVETCLQCDLCEREITLFEHKGFSMVDALVDEKGLEGEPEVLFEASGDVGGAVAGVAGDRGSGDLLVDMCQDILFDLFEELLLLRDMLCIGVVCKEFFE